MFALQPTADLAATETLNNDSHNSHKITAVYNQYTINHPYRFDKNITMQNQYIHRIAKLVV